MKGISHEILEDGTVRITWKNNCPAQWPEPHILIQADFKNGLVVRTFRCIYCMGPYAGYREGINLPVPRPIQAYYDRLFL